MAGTTVPFRCATPVPSREGIGLRTPHYRDMLERLPEVGWLEVHSENYFCAGGQPLQVLERLRQRYPVSLHGVGLSLGSADGLCRDHLSRLKALAGRIEPGLVSEHLSWGAFGGIHLNDLVPLPYTEEALDMVCQHVDEAQSFLGRPILVENVSSYLRYRHSTIPEWEFVAEVARRSGCSILLDVNNIYVNARNHGIDAHAYLRAIPREAVQEMHLAGFEDTGSLLIDTHGERVCDDVWALYGEALARFGPLPTLIEWDTDIPPLDVLLDEAARAARMMSRGTEATHAAAG